MLKILQTKFYLFQKIIWKNKERRFINALIDNLNEIKRQKDEYIIPENIKKDVTILGVTGTLEEGSSEYNAIIEPIIKTRYDMATYSAPGIRYMIMKLPQSIEVDSNVTTMQNMFEDCVNLKNIPSLNTSNIIIMSNMFKNCYTLITIPLLDTGKVTNMSYMFQNCTNLTTIPLLNTSNVTSMQSMFYCPNLTNESLNNILAMCINATKIASNKTLKYIGLTLIQTTTCKELSNYQDFVDAGWSTGY